MKASIKQIRKSGYFKRNNYFNSPFKYLFGGFSSNINEPFKPLGDDEDALMDDAFAIRQDLLNAVGKLTSYKS
ncbi:MAG: hypothetical protein SVZ03_12030 [Spirochaetota bacterium]|nr:hypothetical protein [Spirochaetota bacterium]